MGRTKEQAREYNRRYSRENRDKIQARRRERLKDPAELQKKRDAANKRFQRGSEFISSYRTKCQFCGATEALEFHHKNPLEKRYNISSENLKKMKLTNIHNELTKCWCLCQTCHVRLHQRLMDPLPATYDLNATECNYPLAPTP
jgi:5-methylcytosine-specific restriction endonuclease McrA